MFLPLLVLLALGCRKEKAEVLFPEGEGSCEVAFQVRPDYTLHQVVLTRAGEEDVLSECSVRLENTRAEVLREWKHEELPRLIKVVPGAYKLVAWQGTDTVYPAFEQPYYYGETKITLKEGDNLDTVVNVGLAAVKVAVSFDESFDFEYEDYFVDIKTTGDSLRFLKDETRTGYFKPGNLRLRFGLKRKGENVYREFYPSAIGRVEAKTSCKMKLSADCKNGALQGITITTDASTINIPVDVDLPAIFLPKGAPKVTLSGVEENETLIALEGEKKSVIAAMITSPGGLASLKIKADGAVQNQGWPAEIDLLDADEATLNDLKAKGFEWDEQKMVSGTKLAVWVRLNQAIERLATPALQVVRSGLSICATDRFGQTTESKFDMEIHPALFAELPTEGHIWAKRAEMKLKSDAAAEEVYIEYKPQGGDWQRATMEEISRNAEMVDCWVKNLNPAQEYVFRACVGNYKSIQEFTFTTEEAAQVPNRGFEDWHYTRPKDVKYWEVYYPCLEGETPAWSTMNSLTTSEGGSGTKGYRYKANSGTLETTDCKSGAKAALIRTVGWGSGNTAPAVGGSGWACKNVTPGELCLGALDAAYGFVSRPTKISYYYKYVPKNSADWFEVTIVLKDADNQIIAERVITRGGNVSNYTEEVVTLDYKKISKAAFIYIAFKSSGNSDCWSANKTNLSIPPMWNLSDGEYVGSQLYIDDIELIYE